jgi:hypothetical protein
MPVAEAGVQAAVGVGNGVGVALDLPQQRRHRGASALGYVDEVDVLGEGLDQRFSLMVCRVRSYWNCFRRNNGGGDSGPLHIRFGQTAYLLCVIVTCITSIYAGQRLFLVLQPARRASLFRMDREPE